MISGERARRPRTRGARWAEHVQRVSEGDSKRHGWGRRVLCAGLAGKTGDRDRRRLARWVAQISVGRVVFVRPAAQARWRVPVRAGGRVLIESVVDWSWSVEEWQGDFTLFTDASHVTSETWGSRCTVQRVEAWERARFGLP